MFDGELSDEEWETVYGNKNHINSTTTIDETIFNDSVSALQALGYKKKDAERYASDSFKEGAATPQDVITYALKTAQREKTISSS